MDFHTGEYDWNLSKLFRCDRRDNCRHNCARVCNSNVTNSRNEISFNEHRCVYKEVEEKSSFHHVYSAVPKVVPFFHTVRRASRTFIQPTSLINRVLSLYISRFIYTKKNSFDSTVSFKFIEKMPY